MNFAILTDKKPSFRRPLAEGLTEMFTEAGHQASVFYEGIEMLDFKNFGLSKIFRNGYANSLNVLSQKIKFQRFIHQLKKYDAIIIVSFLPVAFQKKSLFNLELLRKKINIPIVLYMNYYLGNHKDWTTWMSEKNQKFVSGECYGLERYDWYLASSVISHVGLNQKIDNPVTSIGVWLNKKLLFPEQEEFIALLDFERPCNLYERAIQIKALKATNTKYIVLNGEYSHEEICSIFRKISIYFVAFNESFGYTTAELMACGAFVFTPYARWLSAYSLTQPDNDNSIKLPDNFKVYENDENKLKTMIEEAKTQFSAQKNLEHFIEKQPHFYTGNLKNVKEFISLIKNRTITSQSHKDYYKVNKQIGLNLE